MKFKNTQTLLEQVALLFSSFIWTIIVLVGIILFWAYQDFQARWEFIVNAPPELLAEVAMAQEAGAQCCQRPPYYPRRRPGPGRRQPSLPHPPHFLRQPRPGLFLCRICCPKR